MRFFAAIAVLIIVGVAVSPARYSPLAFAQQSPPRRAVPPPQMRVDINHADIDELLKVPGMTRSWAGRIIRFRPYRTKLDLVDRGIVSGEAYNRIKDYLIAHREKQ
jgi:DNA uptake protein ComE-like DNA-binding protein